MNYLLDTNVLSEAIKQKPNPQVLKWLDSVPEASIHISVLTIGEIKKGIEKLSNNNKKKESYRIWLEHTVIERFGERLLNINFSVAERWGKLLAEVNRPLPAIDSLIGATALHYDLILVTRNIQDYEFPSLSVINPWEIKLD